MIFFTSDTHFGHKNIIEYCERPFASIEEMDDVIVDKWNEKVGKYDHVYHLGDFALVKNFNKYIDRLKGNITLIVGNHDHHSSSTLKGANFHAKHDMLTIKGPTEITLCHYAMRCWPQSHYGAWHLFGHNHNKMSPWGKSFDVGVDCHGFKPISIDEVEDIMKTLPEPNWTKK
jgi:calcineurin-like phosphoesterase family protein